MYEHAKKRFSGCDSKNNDRFCRRTRNKDGKPVDVCVLTERDMGKRKAILISGRKIKSYDNVKDLTKNLNRIGVSHEEQIRMAKFVSREFRDSRIEKTETTAGLNYGSIGVKGKRVRKTSV